MRTETEIKTALANLNTFLQVADPVVDKEAIAIQNAQRKALEWALTDGDYPYSYYCLDCHLMHTGIICPKCGNGTLRTVNDKVLESTHYALEKINDWPHD